MFTEFLENCPAAELVRGGTRRLWPTAGDRRAWEKIPEGYRREIALLAEKYAGIPYPLRSASGFLAFVRNGSRQADEKPYFTRRRKLCAAVLNRCVYPDAETDSITDGVWLLCEESSWVISAHNVNPIPGAPKPKDYPLPDVRKPYIDLFSAQTGMILSLTSFLLARELDAVSPLLRQRIRYEIRRRILQPFMRTDDFWWMGYRRTDLNNWTPWILSNILVCAILDPMPAGKLGVVVERVCGMLDRYLSTIPGDGGCDEGAGYWNMAGGALLDCLVLLEKITGGKMCFLENEKIRNILSFPLKAEMGNGWFANFADCDAKPFISGERLETAGRMLDDPALTALGTRLRGTVEDELKDVPHLTRALDLLFHMPAESPETERESSRDVWLPDLQVRMLRRGRWTLACKGGHNGENHNHNDIGTFILFLDGEPAAVDAGNMLYTARTFSDERYTLWNVRSGWHNVPMIGEYEQKEGREYAAREVRCTEDGMRLNLEGAYEASAGVVKLERSFRLNETGLVLEDRGNLRKADTVTWVFLLRCRPEWRDGILTAGSMKIRCQEGLYFRMEEIPVTDSRMARNWPGSLWRVLLSRENSDKIEERFVFMAGKGEKQA